MFFHIVSSVMCLYIRIISYWLFLSYLIYLWFCFQSVIFSEKLLRNSKNPFQRHLFLFLWSLPDFLKFFPVFQENLGFLHENQDFPPIKNSLERCQFQFIQFFLCINKRIKAKERYSRTPWKVIVPTLKKFRNPIKKSGTIKKSETIKKQEPLKNQKPLKIKNHKKIRNH